MNEKREPSKVVKSKLYNFLFRLKWNNRYIFVLKNVFVDTRKLKKINIETTTFCNRKCVFCPKYYDKSPPKEMSTKLFNKILNDLECMSYDGLVSLSHFGEPLMDDRLLAFVRQIKNKLDVKINLFTNGDFLTPEKARELMENGIETIRVSQHDLKPSKQITELKRYNWGKKVVFGVVNSETKGLSNRGGSVKVKSLNPMHCDLDEMIIGVDGKVLLCPNDYYKEVVLGNIEDNTIEEIWGQKRYSTVRRNLKNGKFDFEICKRCRGEKS